MPLDKCTIEPINMFKIGAQDVVIKIDEISTSFQINVSYKANNLSAVYIETDDKKPIASKEDYIDASMKIICKGGVIFNDKIKIKGGGNATWVNYPKKPYRLKLKQRENLLSVDAGKDTAWVLLANYTDKTLLRVAIAFWLSEVFDFPWTPKMEFVDLFINNEYIGNYQLGENVKVSKKRVNIPKATGYLIEVDQYYYQEPNYFIREEYKYGYSFKHPDGKKITGEQRTAILNFINSFEGVLKSDNFKDENSGYRKYIDVESFCKWFLLHEVLANLDTNNYFYYK